ncbi:hypothetical protein SUGI_0220200 [Cryptomeria japonica]|uniref:uncharacterized protein LOC131031029 n=1 Tax=Cryptomeria japonica TaxID=3369 RepID=UPI002408B270|nr:uncharacterized protein LOC131031029 [Cryptomeria japonica]GLJ13796.1 hypothetical protein SUGI_0220200 [Cryptomeria japonica]
MGNCVAKTHALPNNCPPLFPDVNSHTCYSHKKLSAPRPCSVIYSHSSHNFAVKKTAIPEKVNRRSFKLAHLLAKSFVENDNSPMVKKSAIAEQVCVGGSVNKRPFKLAKLAENSFIDNDIPKESPNLSSILSLNSIEKRNCSARVEEANAKFKDSESPRSSGSLKHARLKLSAGLCMPYSLAEEDDMAFGSPMSVERREWSSFDEFSDSSSDLFDIDFRKPESLAAVAFSAD